MKNLINYPILEGIKKEGFFKVKKDQQVILYNGDIAYISEDKIITKKDFGVPLNIPYSPFIPKAIISISN